LALLWNDLKMKLRALAALLTLSIPLAAQAQTARQPGPAVLPAAPDPVAEAYEQFLRGHRLDQENDVDGAIGAYRKAMALDPSAAEVPAELASLYLRQNRVREAVESAERALAIDGANTEANRVLGMAYATLAEGNDTTTGSGRQTLAQNVTKAIQHLERAIEHQVGEPNPNLIATLARLYVSARQFDKAIPLLTELTTKEPGWQDGPLLLVEAYTGAGRNAEAISWLEGQGADDPRLTAVLGELYERERRWREAATAYGAAVQRTPRNLDLKTRYASALLNAGGRSDILKAREALTDVAESRKTDARVLYLLAQAQRRAGDSAASIATARGLIDLQGGKAPWGFYALAEALEQKGDYQGVIDALTPAVSTFRSATGDNNASILLLLPHIGFAHQELGNYDQAIAAFSEAQRRAPTDHAIASNLIEAYIASKQYAAAIETAKKALALRPGDVQLSRLQAQALRRDGQADLGVTLLEEAVRQHQNDPMAYVALAQVYADTDRGAQAVRLLKDAEGKFPGENSILFELGSVYDKQKNFTEAEATFRRVVERDPDNANALNYLGYMLAEQGIKLDESVRYLIRAVQMEPDNGSFLDSLGWAYYKSNKLDLAEPHLKRAAEQLKMNSVIQDHYGDLLFKLSRFDEAIAAWNRALAGDGDQIIRAEIDKKIQAARQKLSRR
jgi:tetratricopeptide (TPR) repeat protein